MPTNWLNPEYSTSFYHISRHPEIVVTKDRDVVAFLADTVTLGPTTGMGIYRDSTKAITSWSCSVSTNISERLLLWGRVEGTEAVSAFRWVPYVVGTDTDVQAIKPLREVYAPRVAYDKSSNTIHLWFWTNVNWDYNGTDYDEDEIYPIRTNHYGSLTGIVSGPESKVKRVLCFAVGRFEHAWVEGGYVGGYTGVSGGPDTRYDLIPIFNRPKIVTNYSPAAGAGPGLVTDGWYEGYAFPFQLVQQDDKIMGVRCGFRRRNGLAAQCPYGPDGMSGYSTDLSYFWTHDYDSIGDGDHWIGFRFKVRTATVASSYDSELIPDSFDGTQSFYLEQVLQNTNPVNDALGGEDKFENILWVGKVTTASSGNIVSYQQLWWGGDENSAVAIPDTNFTNAQYSTARYTIERNPEISSPHRYELQLYNMRSCRESSYSMPYFNASAPSSGVVPGNLAWAAIDNHYKSVGTSLALARSLEIRATGESGGYTNLQIYKFFEGTAGTPDAVNDKVLIRRHGGGLPYVGYEPITSFGGASHLFNSVATTGTAYYMTAISNGTPTGYLLGYAYISWTGGRIVHQGTGGQQQDVLTSGGGGSLTLNLYWSGPGSIKHADLDYTGSSPVTVNKSTNEDHDYRYVRQGDTYDKAFLASLGYKSGVPGNLSGGSLRIDLLACTLVSDGTNWTVDWDGYQMQDGSQKLSVDWSGRCLYYTNGTTATVNWLSCTLTDYNNILSADWHSRQLYDTNSSKLSVDWQNRKLISDNGSTEVMCWDVNPVSGWFLTWSADETWTHATFKAKPTGDIVLDASTGGMLTLKAKNASTWTFANLTLHPSTNLTYALKIGNGGTSEIWTDVDIWSQDVRFWAGAAYGTLQLGDLTACFENILFNGVAGVDIPLWTTKGGVTGTLVEKEWQNVNPTDKILVRE